jgi:hypothetical protein
MKRSICGLAAAGVVLALASPPALAGTANHGIDDEGVRFANWRGEARVGEATAPAELRLLCRPGQGGALGWTLLVEGTSSLEGFDFDAFDGTSARTRGQELATLGLRGGVLAPTVDTAVNGSRTDATRFAFAWGSDVNVESKASLLADAIGPATDRLTWVLSQIDEEAELLRADFDLSGSAADVRETMAGCGPVPALPIDRLVGWQVAGATVATVLGDPAVAWRVRAAVGREWAEVEGRLSRLGPWRVDGEVLHAVAEGPGDSDGSALLLAGDSDAVEVLLIDAGVLRRLAGGAAALNPPASIREFVEARVGGGERDPTNEVDSTLEGESTQEPTADPVGE